MNKQFEYYTKNNIHAVEYVDDIELTDFHEKQRKNLVENHLGIPMLLFKEKEVLEFGPCSGENALILSNFGAKIEFVEPNVEMHDKIRKTFALNNPLPSISSNFVEDFKSNKKYDFVIAEGFIHALSNRHLILEKLFDLSKGFVIVTYSCAYGYFFESLKRYIFARGHKLEQVDADDFPGKIALAKELFWEDFKKLKTARTFESWALDILINPCQTSNTLDEFSNYVAIAKKRGFNVHGISPNWDMRDRYRWYKNFSEKSIIDEWKDNLSFIIFGEKDVIIDPSDLALSKDLTSIFMDYSCDKITKSSSEIAKLSQRFSNRFLDLKQLLNIADRGNFSDIKSIYLASENCRNWGMPHHYITFIKNQ